MISLRKALLPILALLSTGVAYAKVDAEYTLSLGLEYMTAYMGPDGINYLTAFIFIFAIAYMGASAVFSKMHSNKGNGAAAGVAFAMAFATAYASYQYQWNMFGGTALAGLAGGGIFIALWLYNMIKQNKEGKLRGSYGLSVTGILLIVIGMFWVYYDAPMIGIGALLLFVGMKRPKLKQD